MSSELKEWCEGLNKLKDVMRNEHTKTVEMAVTFTKKLYSLIDGKYSEPEVSNMRQQVTFFWEPRGDNKIRCTIAWHDDATPHCEVDIVQETDERFYYETLPFTTDQEQDDAVAVFVSEFLRGWKFEEEIKTDEDACAALCEWIKQPPDEDHEYNDLVTNIDEVVLPLMKKLHSLPLPTYGNDSDGTVSLYWRRLETEKLRVDISQLGWDAHLRVYGRDAKDDEYSRTFGCEEMDQLAGYLAQTYADIFQ
jgi:hypothetical protein